MALYKEENIMDNNEKQKIKEKELRKYYKMYIKFRGNYPSKESSAYYRRFTNSNNKMHQKGYLEGSPIDITTVYRNEMIDILNTNKFINCFDISNDLIFVGTKNSDEPFDIFDSECNVGEILIYNKDMNCINIWTTKEGPVVEIDVDYINDLYYNCLVLLHSGKLIEFKYIYKNNEKEENEERIKREKIKREKIFEREENEEIIMENNSYMNNSMATSKIYDIRIIEKEMKVIKFTREKYALVYTDGFQVKIVNKQNIVVSGIFTSVIVDLLCIYVENELMIVFVDINGKHFYCNGVFNNFTLIGYYPGFYKLKRTDKNIIISTDGVSFKRIYNFFKRRKRL